MDYPSHIKPQMQIQRKIIAIVQLPQLIPYQYKQSVGYQIMYWSLHQWIYLSWSLAVFLLFVFSFSPRIKEREKREGGRTQIISEQIQGYLSRGNKGVVAKAPTFIPSNLPASFLITMDSC